MTTVRPDQGAAVHQAHLDAVRTAPGGGRVGGGRPVDLLGTVLTALVERG